jgi:hypothetical protein
VQKVIFHAFPVAATAILLGGCSWLPFVAGPSVAWDSRNKTPETAELTRISVPVTFAVFEVRGLHSAGLAQAIARAGHAKPNSSGDLYGVSPNTPAHVISRLGEVSDIRVIASGTMSIADGQVAIYKESLGRGYPVKVNVKGGRSSADETKSALEAQETLSIYASAALKPRGTEMTVTGLVPVPGEPETDLRVPPKDPGNTGGLPLITVKFSFSASVPPGGSMILASKSRAGLFADSYVVVLVTPAVSYTESVPGLAGDPERRRCG